MPEVGLSVGGFPPVCAVLLPCCEYETPYRACSFDSPLAVTRRTESDERLARGSRTMNSSHVTTIIITCEPYAWCEAAEFEIPTVELVQCPGDEKKREFRPRKFLSATTDAPNERNGAVGGRQPTPT